MSKWHIWQNLNKEDGWRGNITRYSDKVGYDSRFGWQILLGKRFLTEPGFSITFGNRSSETPIDAHVHILGLAIYVNLNFNGLGALCAKLGRGHKRELSLKIHDGSLWWRLWYNDDMGYDCYHKCDKRRKPVWPWSMGRDKYRSWMCLRDGSLDLNPLDALWGHRYYKYVDLIKVETEIDICQYENDVYPIVLKLQTQYRKRDFGPSWAAGSPDTATVVDWDAPQGIPFRNHSWKGECVYGSAVGLPQDPMLWMDDWVRAAKEAIRAQIIKDRARYHYVREDA